MKLGMARCHACGQIRTDIGAQVRCDKCGKVVHEKEAHTLAEPLRLPEQYVPQRTGAGPKQQQGISAFTPRKAFDLCEDCANELQASFFKREVARTVIHQEGCLIYKGKMCNCQQVTQRLLMISSTYGGWWMDMEPEVLISADENTGVVTVKLWNGTIEQWQESEE